MPKTQLSVGAETSIRILLRMLATADADEQKVIRRSIRKIGLQISDFPKRGRRFSEADFDTAITSNRIEIVDEAISTEHRSWANQAESVAKSSVKQKAWPARPSNKLQEFIEQRERCRLHFRPDRIKVLFVGESLPSGGDFFYQAYSALYRHTQAAFSIVFGEDCGKELDFLSFFKQCECYLDDLCLVPANDKGDSERAQIRQEGILPLAKRMNVYDPSVIVVVMKAIKSEVRKAQIVAGLGSVPFYTLSFPNHYHYQGYIKELARLLPGLLKMD